MQGVTLPHVTVSIDETVFVEGQVYVTMSRATSWKNLHILNFDPRCIKLSKATLEEYKRLDRINKQGLQNMYM